MKVKVRLLAGWLRSLSFDTEACEISFSDAFPRRLAVPCGVIDVY